MRCLIQMPEDSHGRYVLFKENLTEGPDTGDIIGILTITDVTEETMSERIFHQLSVATHDYVVDVDLLHDTYSLLTYKKGAAGIPTPRGSHSKWVGYMAESVVLLNDRRQYAQALEADEIRRSIEGGPYTFTYSIAEKGSIRIKSMTVASIEPLLDRYCMVCTDITDSVREQQGLLNMMAYTFELMGFLDINNGCFTMYTRKMVLENLPPHIMADYNRTIEVFIDSAIVEGAAETLQNRFQLECIMEHLEKEPSGYDFVVAYHIDGGIRYKQFNMLWGNQDHNIVCMVRADVTDMIAAERSAKRELEKALASAEEANQAKSNFLSAMSHDIRTPMNAIIGMTTLAKAHIDDRSRIEEYLQKISASGSHLLSLINDVLDVSRIERSKITLTRMNLQLSDLMEQLTAILVPLAKEKGVELSVCTNQVSRREFPRRFPAG